MTTQEYNIGQLYTTAEVSREETGGGEGVEIVDNLPFDSRNPEFQAINPDPPLLNGDPEFICGQYTFKRIFLSK